MVEPTADDREFYRQMHRSGDPRDEYYNAGEHRCVACSVEFRDLFAVAHNVVTNRGDEPRFTKKLCELERAVERYQVLVDRHFAGEPSHG